MKTKKHVLKKAKLVKKTRQMSGRKSGIKKQKSTRHVPKNKTVQKKSKSQKQKTKKAKSIRTPKEIIIHQEIIPQDILSDYIFAFELTRPYPTVRSYLLKQPLKKPVKDILFELFGTGK